MNIFFKRIPRFLRKPTLAKLCGIFLVLFLIFPLFSCNKSVRYFDYVSELRSNIFLAEAEGFSLRIYSVVKESPYATDGIPQETYTRTEVYLVAPQGNATCNLTFTANGQEYGGEMSFDNVKMEYSLSCALDTSSCTTLPCRISYGSQELELTANSVLTEQTLTPQAVLQNLQTEEAELFSSMTDKYGFTGEIYIRLIFEDSPYYYVGIIDRDGGIHAFLINAETGKILAKRQP